ncbi:MAG TPA: sialate O-acetylesterase [Clostridia bacterium]|nr:sialate O-acetylesterase [Clostridia bacterium]
MKKFLSVLLVLCLAIGVLLPAASAQVSTDASLLQIYGNNMLFARNKPITLAGYAAPGAQITAKILLGGNTIVRTGTATARADGSFEVVTDGINGSYAEYTVKVYADDMLFATLTGVVFGALWLASGQSNMQYPLYQTYEGFALSKSGSMDRSLRVLDVPAYPEYNGSGDNLPYELMDDIKGASWYKATDTERLMTVSAVAYFFANELRKELNMPVGILNASLGGSSIYTWLSRDAIDTTPAVKDYLVSTGRYITAQDWNDVKPNPYANMTANFNKKINPLRHFEPDGLIWYQGESDISAPHGTYTNAMNLMQESYSALFGYRGSQMPFVFTQLASYNYGTSVDDFNLVGNFNIELGEIQAQSPTTRAMTTIYDVSLEWDTKKIDKDMGRVGAIHPMVKKPVGDKMAFAALGLVYGKHTSYSAPLVSETTVDGESILVKFAHVGDGLAVKPYVFTGQGAGLQVAPLYGFSIAGANGIYVEAKAQIIAPDTVKIWSDNVKSPVSATYAYSQVNNYSNLFATQGDDFTLGVCPFITRRLDKAKYVQDKYWTTCELNQIWRALHDPLFVPAFKANTLNTWVSYSTVEKACGTAALKVDYVIPGNKHKTFAFGPELTYRKNLVPTPFPCINRDYSMNALVSFQVKNASDRSVSLDEMRFYTNAVTWFSPLKAGGGPTSVTIPADGRWHTVTLDLSLLCLYGNTDSFKTGGDILKDVFDIQLRFSDDTAVKGDGGTIFVDDFQFHPRASESRDYTRYNITLAFELLFKALAKMLTCVLR